MNHEVDAIRSFVVKAKRDRYIESLSSPRKRTDFVRKLAHFKDIDPRYKVPIPSSKRGPAGITDILRSKGAGSHCWAISENPEIDGKELPILDALKRTVGYGMGTILSCSPGRLAFFESEDERCILERLEQPLSARTYVRFAAPSVDSDSHQEEGVFAAAYRLRDSGSLSEYEREEIRGQLRWFEDRLPEPTSFARASQKKGISWFKADAKECISRIWSIIAILKEHSLSIKKITTTQPGFVVYEDEFQIVAEPFRDGTF